MDGEVIRINGKGKSNLKILPLAVLDILRATEETYYITQDSQTMKKKTKIPRVTDEGWNSQKQLSGPVEKKKKKEKTLVSSFKLSLGLVTYMPFTL